MGNHAGKDNIGHTGSPLDFFSTPPTSPSEDSHLTALASASSSVFTNKMQTGCNPCPPAPTPSNCPRQRPLHGERAPIGNESQRPPLEKSQSREKVEEEAAVAKQWGTVGALGSPPLPPPPCSSPVKPSWQERDSGLESQLGAEQMSQETNLVMQSLMEYYKASLGLSPGPGDAEGAVELLRRLVSERGELAQEVLCLKETLRTERAEWRQFQRDLQVAVSVADRLRTESEEAVVALRERHGAVEAQLAQALRRHRAQDRELQDLRARLQDAGHQLPALFGERPRRPQEGASLDAIKKKVDGGNGTPDLRRVVLLPERSWSLSRLPLPDTADKNSPSLNSSSTLPLCKKEEPAKGKKTAMLLQRQDSWSNLSAKKQDEDQNSESIRPQDGFSVLLRCHGGSRRNALLRWCQTRTQGYKNIEITNFSTSWEDGLAFCAMYHSYLPSHIPYGSLTPEDKKGNLDLAFQTGKSIGITATLTVEEMLKADGPNWQRVLGYVEGVFRHFEM
ncbi:hypothetical protein NHX12_026284 [Muraenolepis orangiensis]|uniref:Cytospin-A n=1 Tax=Muraenolepis orangiensis TaxID=630683 RepID=A0A9Q0EG90_9TELE|nr:hypothetical protein NHX12_026284 [Muraenolepis orangiensis]